MSVDAMEYSLVVGRAAAMKWARTGLVAGALLLAGCGINALRTEYAGKVGTQGSAVAAASSEFLKRVDSSRRSANIEMVAVDPACGRSPAFVRGDIAYQLSTPGWLCVPEGALPSASDSRFGMRPISQDLEPTVVTIGALASYAEALSDIVDSEPSDPLKPLLDALATARSAQGLLLAVTGSESGQIPPANDARLTAIQEFVGLLSELSDEAAKVTAVRKLLAEHPEGAALTIAALKGHLLTWENSRKGDDATRVLINAALLRRVVVANPPAAPDARRKAMTTFYDMQNTARTSAEIYPALVKALDDLAEADADLRRVIVEHPNLSKKERARRAEINRQRAIRAMDGLAGLITAFKGGA